MTSCTETRGVMSACGDWGGGGRCGCAGAHTGGTRENGRTHRGPRGRLRPASCRCRLTSFYLQAATRARGAASACCDWTVDAPQPEAVRPPVLLRSVAADGSRCRHMELPRGALLDRELPYALIAPWFAALLLCVCLCVAAPLLLPSPCALCALRPPPPSLKREGGGRSAHHQQHPTSELGVGRCGG